MPAKKPVAKLAPVVEVETEEVIDESPLVTFCRALVVHCGITDEHHPVSVALAALAEDE